MKKVENNWTIFYPEFEKNLIDEINDIALFKDFRENEYITKYGEYIHYTMLVYEGMVKVYRQDDDGHELLMYYISAGDACAISILCTSKEQKSMITAKVIEDCSLILIPFDKTEAWLGKYKSWTNFVINTYRSRFETLLFTLDSVVFNNMDERLLYYIKRHKSAEGPIIYLSHQKIAEELNTSREVISRLLKKMEQKGMLKLHRNQIEILLK